MLTAYLEQLIQKKDLSFEQSVDVINKIVSGADSHQVAALLVLLRAKTETAEEVFGMVQAMRQHMHTVPIAAEEQLLDIVGTGGDCANTINISTAASILAASCGVKVAKHGNRSVSSRCGSADFLAALGINIHMDGEQVASCINTVGIGFCFAPQFHPAMQQIKSVRNALKIPTLFNMMGTLLNPAKAQHYLLGVANETYLNLIADVLLKLKVQHAFVVHDHGGLDELSLLGPASVIEVTSHGKREFTLDPRDYGFSYCQLTDLQGGDASINVARVMLVFNNPINLDNKTMSPLAETIVFNAGVALYCADAVSSIADGIALAKERLIQGAPKALIESWITFQA